MSFNLNVREVSGVSIVDVSGRVTLGDGAGTLRDRVREMAAAGKKSILLDLGALSNLDSTGIGVLVSSGLSLRHRYHAGMRRETSEYFH